MKSYRFLEHDLLAEYDTRNANDASFWDDHWSKKKIEISLQRSAHGYIGEMRFLCEHLPRQGTVLEAGCGRGQLVMGLTAKGYDVCGVDFADSTITLAKRCAPELKLHLGDLRRLPFKDNAFSVYLSFGVVEHFTDESDLKQIFDEAKRVTSGVIFISVPHLTAGLRRRIARERLESVPQRDASEFYQYYFTRDSFTRFLEQFELRPSYFSHYSTVLGLKRNHLFFSRLYNNSKVFRFGMKKAATVTNKVFGKRYSHMIGAWCIP